MRRRRAVNFKLSLDADLVARRLIGKLRNKLVSLCIDIRLAWWSLWRFDISREELLCGFSFLALDHFGVMLLLVRLEQLVGVSAGWDHHCGVGTSTEHAFVEGDVLWVVLFTLDAAVGVLVFLFVGHNAGVGGETALVLGVAQHFF